MPTRSNLLTPSPPIADPSNPETPDIKPLASLFPHAGQPRWVQEDRDLARTDFFKEVSEYCDLTTEVAVWRYTREVHPSFTINHRMDPRPEMEDMFPLRDPLDPRKVHRRYANASGELDGRVAVYAVESLREALRTLMKSCGIPHQDQLQLCNQLEVDVRVELDRLIKGHRRAPYYEVRKLQVHEVADHEQALIGQYGLFGLPLEHPQRQPVLENGRVLGLFVGALLQNAEEEDAYAQAYPGHSSYTVTFQVKNQSKNKRNRTRLVGVTGLGVTNGPSFANTALKEGSPATYDRERLNSHLMPFRVGLLDNQGKPSRATVVALIATASAYGSGNPTREFRVDYGPDFLQEFDDQKASDAVRPMEIKQEMEVDLPQAGASSASAGLRRELGRTLHMAAQVDEPGPGEEVQWLAPSTVEVAVASLCPAKVHSPASSRVAVSLQAHTPPNLESAQAAPQMLDGWLQPAPPSRVQATADPVSRKRPLGPDQPGEGPSGIKRGAPILRQLPEALPRLPVFLESPAPHRQDHARSLRPWRADLLTNDPRHQFESAQAAADPVSRKRPLVPEQAQPSSLRHWQRELLKAVPPVTTQTRSAHARRLILETKRWPVPMLTEDLMTMSGVGYSMAQAVRKLTNLPQLQILMRQHEQRFRESDRDYARRLLGKGARADALNAVFHLTLKDLVSEAPRAKVVGVSLQTSPQLGAPVSGADTSADRSGQRTVQGLSGVALRTAAGGGEWPPNQPLQQWHRELLALEPPAAVGALESPMGHARRLALLAYPVRGLLAPEDLSWMAGIDLVDAAMVRLLPERKALSALLRQHRQQPWESDLQYIVRIQAEGVERQDVKYLYKVSRHGLPQSQWNLPEAPLLSSLPPSRDHPDPAWGQARPLLPWQQTLLRDFPRGLVETASAHARRLVLKVDRWPGPVLAQDIEAMTGVGSCVARNIRKLVDFPELRRLMGQYPQDFRESDRDYARRLAEHAAPPTDLCCVFSMALSQLFPAPTQDGASVLREPPVPPQPGEGASGTDTAIDRSDKRPVQGIPGVEERTDASSIVWRRNQPLQSWQQALLTLEPPPAPGSLESSDGHARRLALAAYRGKGVLRVEDLMLMANIDWAAAVRERLLPLRKHLPTLMRTYRQQPSESDLHYARRLKREGATSRDLKFVFRVNADQLLEASSGPLTLPKSPSHRPTHWRPTLPGPSENSDRSMLAEGGYTGPPAEPSTAPSVSGPSPDAAP